MALTTKEEVVDESFGNIPPFLSMIVYAIRPNISGPYLERFTRTWSQDYQLVRQAEEKKLGCRSDSGEGTGEATALGGFTCHGDIATMRSCHGSGKT